MSQQVQFWFDVSCPFAWVTSRWMTEVEKVRDIEVKWVPMSLSVLNEGRDELPEAYKEKMKANWGPARVFAAVATEHPEKVGELYSVMGTIIHNEGNGGKADFGAYDEIIMRALRQLGLEEYAEVANTDTWDEALRAFHQGAMDAVGDEVGTPVVKFGDTAFFGPVITRVPRGEDAGEFFDAAVTLAKNPHFFEIKRTRTEGPDATI